MSATDPAAGVVPAGLAAGEIVLPGFVQRRADGLYLDAGEAGNPANILAFFERVFGNAACFDGLDYAALLALLYPRRADDEPLPPPLVVRIAKDIRAFPAERCGLYKAIKFVDAGARVEYVFEPLQFERSGERPVFSTDSAGNLVQTGSVSETWFEPTQADRDEFIAAMWQKGLRFGLDMAAVDEAIAAVAAKPSPLRIDIAHRQDAQPGQDASLVEKSTALHRDDRPHILPNGKLDLGQFANRFPQVSAGTCLFVKDSRRLGTPGYGLDGKRIESAMPRDFVLDDIAGTGTHVERTGEGERIVADIDGFLHIDAASHKVSISDKIVNKTGVSMRTTGNLALAGEHFEEHGEVQEKRLVEGLHMRFFADVFGSISSNGGNVNCESNLVGGRVSNPGGKVEVKKRCSNAQIEARGGSITLSQAEGCILIAGTVHIDRAVGCDIVADEIVIGEATGCALLGRHVRLASSTCRREINTVVSIVVPDLAPLQKRLAETRATQIQCLEQRAAAMGQKNTLLADAGFRAYVAAEASLRAGKLNLNGAQEAQLQQLGLKYARPMQALREMTQRIEQAAQRHDELQSDIGRLEAELAQAGVGFDVHIDAIRGDTLVRTTSGTYGGDLLPGVGIAQVHARLRDPALTLSKLFDGDAGSFVWVSAAPVKT